MMDDMKLRDECGVFGIYSDADDQNVASSAYLALYALQHRGQMSCGIAVGDHGIIKSHKDNGLVPEVFSREVLDSLGDGHIAVGHVRYGTSDNADRASAQPMVIRHVRGNIAICFNGQLCNARELRQELEMSGAIFHTNNDCEVIAYIFTRERLNAASTEEALANTMKRLRGAYSIVMMSAKKLLAARDPQGFRPLCIGKRAGQLIFASESCALSTLGAELVRDVEPGEIVIANKDGLTSIPALTGQETGMCVFEFVYIARPDSVLDGAGVHEARQRAGAYLALEHPVAADVVVGAPGMPQGGYPGLTFQRDPDYVPPVWPGKPGDQQTMEHLDFAVDDLPAAVARAVSLGARVADEQFTQDWTVMLDPEGHPFCLLNMQAVMQSEGFALR